VCTLARQIRSVRLQASISLQELSPCSGMPISHRPPHSSHCVPFSDPAQRRRAGGGGSAVDARVGAALETVARELEKPQLVKHLAARLHLSPSRFEHIFKGQTGEGFKAFLRAVRMARAKDLLQDPALRIKEVAAAVGYADASDFTRDFRKQYGESPSQSRRYPPQRGRAARTEGPRRGARSRLAGPPSHRQRMRQAQATDPSPYSTAGSVLKCAMLSSLLPEQGTKGRWPPQQI
jgi:AraC-like DNA-binding protein